MSRTIIAFVEDDAHQQYIKALLQRLSEEHNVNLDSPIFRASTGGAGEAITGLVQFLKDLEADNEFLPDLILIMIDSNCNTYRKKKREIEERINWSIQFQSGFVIIAIPDPHIERWLLLDSKAFKTVFGVGCKAPDKKCGRHRYKELLANEIRKADIEPAFGGIEYTENIIREIDMGRMRDSKETIGRFILDLESRFEQWAENC